jgi:hypothetical protein
MKASGTTGRRIYYTWTRKSAASRRYHRTNIVLYLLRLARCRGDPVDLPRRRDGGDAARVLGRGGGVTGRGTSAQPSVAPQGTIRRRATRARRRGNPSFSRPALLPKRDEARHLELASHARSIRTTAAAAAAVGQRLTPPRAAFPGSPWRTKAPWRRRRRCWG